MYISYVFFRQMYSKCMPNVTQMYFSCPLISLSSFNTMQCFIFHCFTFADCLSAHYELCGPKSATNPTNCYFIQSKKIHSGPLKGFIITSGSRCKGDHCFQFVLIFPSFFVLIVVYRKGFFNCGVAFIKPWHLEDKNGAILNDSDATQ